MRSFDLFISLYLWVKEDFAHKKETPKSLFSYCVLSYYFAQRIEKTLYPL